MIKTYAAQMGLRGVIGMMNPITPITVTHRDKQNREIIQLEAIAESMFLVLHKDEFSHLHTECEMTYLQFDEGVLYITVKTSDPFGRLN